MSFDLSHHLCEQAEAVAANGFNFAMFIAGFCHANDNDPSKAKSC